MADINIEKKGDKEKKGNSNWWVWVVVAILAILVAWMALSDRNEIDGEETQQEEYTPGLNEDTRLEQAD